MRIAMPTVEQVRQLPALYEVKIPPEWQDLNEHVNVKHYLDIYDNAGWPLMHELGLDADRFRVQRNGYFDLEHHIWYLAEMHVGDVVTTHFRLLGFNAKRFHGVTFIINRTRNELANVLEFVTTSADLDTRRTTPIPADIAANLERVLTEHSALAWPAPRSGAIAP